MRKLALALAAVAALSITAPAGAAIITTSYSVSGSTLSGTFSLDFNDATSTYTLHALDLTLGAEFDTEGCGSAKTGAVMKEEKPKKVSSGR